MSFRRRPSVPLRPPCRGSPPYRLIPLGRSSAQDDATRLPGHDHCPVGTERGSVVTLTEVDLDRMHLIEAALFDGASSGLLGPDDLTEVGKAQEPGTAAGVLVYENTWAAPFATALRRSGAQLVASGRIPIQDVIETLDATDHND